MEPIRLKLVSESFELASVLRLCGWDRVHACMDTAQHELVLWEFGTVLSILITLS